MKCGSCGYENREGSRFCEKCGSMLKIERKCPSCGNIVGEGALFCQFCGTRLDGKKAPTASDGFSMGDKNVIAGDVFGSKEDIHISGNATIVKSTDDTKKLQVCSVCGKHVMATEGYTCPECGRFVCSSCYDELHGMCIDCRLTELEAKETEYTSFLKQVITGPLTELKLDELVRKGCDYEVSCEKAKALVNDVLHAVGANIRSSLLSSVERSIVDEVEAEFYEKWDNETTKSCFEKLYPVYEKHQKDQRVIDVLLPIMMKYNVMAASEFVNRCTIPSAVLSCAKVDLALIDGNVVEAVNIIEDAKLSFGDDVRLKAKEIDLLLACSVALGQRIHCERAKKLAEALEEKGTRLERSLAFCARVHAGMYADSEVTPDVIRSDSDLYYGYCLSEAEIRVGETSFCHFSSMTDAVANCPSDWRISVLPGWYHLDFQIGKLVHICPSGYQKGHVPSANPNPSTDVIFQVPQNMTVQITPSVDIRGVVFTNASAPDALSKPLSNESDISVIRLADAARLECCAVIGTASHALIADAGKAFVSACRIRNVAKSGIRVLNDASTEIRNTECAECKNGFYLKDSSHAVIENCTVSGCSGSGYVIQDSASPEIRNSCSQDGKANGFSVSGNANPFLEKCTAKGNAYPQYCVKDSATGRYVECVAEAGKSYGFWAKGNAAPEMEKCIAKGNEKSGFWIEESATGRYVECVSNEGKANGFWVTGNANPFLEKCTAKGNAYPQYGICGSATGKLVECVAEEGNSYGFWVKGCDRKISRMRVE